MRRWVMAAIALGVFSTTAPAWSADCQLRMFSAKTVENNSGVILISVLLGDKPAVFMVDTGAFWSTIRKRDTADLKIEHSPVAIYGAGGKAMSDMVHVPSFKIGPGELKDREFIVVPDAMAVDDRIDGVIGGNFLKNFDLELDLANDVVNFFVPSHCGEHAVYWPNSSVAAVPLQRSNNFQIHFAMELDGKDVSALIDTGASNTILSLDAASELFGLHTDSPGVEPVGSSRTMDGEQLPLYRHQFGVLAVGGLTFRHPWLTLGEDRIAGHQGWSRTDQLILGTHQLRQLHLYISYEDEMLYATASAPPAAAASEGASTKKLDPLDLKMLVPLLQSANGHLQAKQTELAIADADEIIRRYPLVPQGYFIRAQIKLQTGSLDDAAADLDLTIKADPQFVDAYILRGQVLQALHRPEQARADMDKAIELAPNSPNGYFVRGTFRHTVGDDEGALADYDKTIALQSKYILAYRARAEVFAQRQDYGRAQADLDQALAAGPHDAGVYLSLAALRARQGQYDAAVGSVSQAIELDPKASAAYNDRCWYRAILGLLDVALDDCNQAIALDSRNASAYDSRGFVELKQHRATVAVADYDRALAINPTLASALYARAMAKQAQGDARGAKADILAAQRIQPDVARHYGK